MPSDDDLPLCVYVHPAEYWATAHCPGQGSVHPKFKHAENSIILATIYCASAERSAAGFQRSLHIVPSPEFQQAQSLLQLRKTHGSEGSKKIALAMEIRGQECALYRVRKKDHFTPDVVRTKRTRSSRLESTARKENPESTCFSHAQMPMSSPQ